MNSVAEFNDSFERNVTDNFECFFSTFYGHFETLSPQISAVFAQTNESRRHEMLEDSILMLMDYSVAHQASDELKRLATFHHKLGIPTDMFDDWLAALIRTLRELDPKFSPVEEQAWRTVLTPGIDFMKGFCPL